MTKISLDTQDILDLIFDKKIIVGDQTVFSEDSTLRILNAIEERLIYGKAFRSENSVFRRPNHTENTASRKRVA